MLSRENALAAGKRDACADFGDRLIDQAHGAFAVAAIGSMMGLANAGARGREGARMGVWGAAQALAFALGGVAGTGLADLARAFGASALDAYAFVFLIEAAAFVASADIARRLGGAPARAASAPILGGHHV